MQLTFLGYCAHTALRDLELLKLPQLLATTLLVSVFADTPVRGQDIELTDCRINGGPAYPSIKARCGTFTRPLDPGRPDGSTVELAVAVVPALSLEPEADPLVPIAGGPGQSTITFYAATRAAFEPIRRTRDIVLIDQRGTGQSAKLECDIDDDVVQGRLSAEETRAVTEDCVAELTFDPRFFTTSVAVSDLEALRGALGYAALNVYGISYGSRVAQHYARRYPDSTRSVILDGVVPPQMALGPAIATEAQQALNAIFARCAEDPACGERFPDLAERFSTLDRTLNEAAVSVTVAHPVRGELTSIDYGADELAATIRLLSYHPTTVALIPLLIDEGANGNLAPLAGQFLTITSTLNDSLSIGMHNAVACTEDAPFFTGEGVSDQELAETYIGPVLLEALAAICSVWPKGVLDDGFKQPLATDVPVLLLSGEADPITPPGYAERAAVDLGTAYLHIGTLQGHGQAPRGCMPEVMATFVVSPNDNPLDDDCLGRTFAMPFFLGFSGPAP